MTQTPPPLNPHKADADAAAVVTGGFDVPGGCDFLSVPGHFGPADAVLDTADSTNAIDLTALALGTTMLGMLTARYDGATAQAFASRILAPTLPGTPERLLQDKTWDLLTTRLAKLAAEAA